MSRMFIEFYKQHKQYISGVKYKIAQEDNVYYYIGTEQIPKSWEGKKYTIGFIAHE